MILLTKDTEDTAESDRERDDQSKVPDTCPVSRVPRCPVGQQGLNPRVQTAHQKCECSANQVY